MQKFLFQLSQLNHQDWKDFTKHVSLHTSKNQVLRFIELLKKNYPHFNLNKETIYFKVFQNETYNDHSYRNLIYQTNLLFKQYLFTQSTKNNDLNHLLYIRTLQRTGMKKAYSSEIAGLKDIESKPMLSYFTAYEKMNNLNLVKDRQTDRHLQSVNDALDLHYLNEKLKITCTAINDQNINSTIYSYGFLSSIEKDIYTYIQNKESFLYLLFQCYLFLRYENEDAFLEVLQQIEKNKNTYKFCEELSMIMSFSINFCIRRINLGDQIYYKHIFVLYNSSLELKTIFDDHGNIPAVSMRNILSVSIRQKEYKWSEKFIEDYKTYLPILHREENYNYLKARLFYAKKEYIKCLKFLLQSEPEDFINNLATRVLLVKCYYELDDYEQMENSLQNFRLFLIRHKSKTYHYSFHVKFISYALKIIKLPPNKKKKSDLLKKLMDVEQIAEKSWLLEILT